MIGFVLNSSMMLIGFDGIKLNCGYYCDVDVFHVWLVGQETTTERRQATRDPVGGLPGVKRKGQTPKTPQNETGNPKWRGVHQGHPKDPHSRKTNCLLHRDGFHKFLPITKKM